MNLQIAREKITQELSDKYVRALEKLDAEAIRLLVSLNPTEEEMESAKVEAFEYISKLTLDQWDNPAKYPVSWHGVISRFVMTARKKKVDEESRAVQLARK